jgi:hypothetical protein
MSVRSENGIGTDSEAPIVPAPRSWLNWRAKRERKSALEIFEMRLYSDAWFISEAFNLGPYSFLNTVPSMRAGRMYELKPGIVLRAEWLLLPESSPPLETNDDLYHGRDPFDEIAALTSLLLDARIAARPIDRDFNSWDDPLGRPRGHDATFLPLLPTSHQAPQIPRLQEQRDLRNLAALATYPLIPAEAASALVKAAHLFQNALWIADSTPEMAWLLLVSAIETAANQWDGDTRTPEERLAMSYRSLIDILRKAEVEHLVPKIAHTLRGVIGATPKFVGFMETFMPPEPTVRPQFGRLDFAPEALRDAMKRVYGLRSRALHAGIPFPSPMCRPPDRSENGVAEETPTGLAAATLGASWKTVDTPMLLHSFAYLTRGALLNWWRSLVPTRAEPDDPPFSDRLTDTRPLTDRLRKPLLNQRSAVEQG